MKTAFKGAMAAAVIFDLYGTLLRFPYDSRPFQQLALRHPGGSIRSFLEFALASNNPTLDDFSANIGLPPQNDLPTLEAALQNDIANVRLFADVVPTLRILKQRGVKIAVISNLATPYKKPFATYHLKNLVDVTVFSCDCGLFKPQPEIYRLALEQLGSLATETLMVGDSFKSDVDGPGRVGIMGVHLMRWGGVSPADHVVSSLDGVLEIAGAGGMDSCPERGDGNEN